MLARAALVRGVCAVSEQGLRVWNKLGLVLRGQYS